MKTGAWLTHIPSQVSANLVKMHSGEFWAINPLLYPFLGSYEEKRSDNESFIVRMIHQGGYNRTTVELFLHFV